MGNEVYNELVGLITEARNPVSMKIDEESIENILRIINSEDKNIPAVIENEIPYIKKAVELVVDAFKNGGRLIYIGAGTSGRLGVLDASECPPTYGTPPEMVQGIIAGGYDALVKSQEGSEDRRDDAKVDLKEKRVSEKDVVCGITASKRTPYVIAGIEYAKSIGAKTIFVTCNKREEVKLTVDVAVCPVVGPEVIMGSTRMKAGTAQKLVLNMITTTAMIQIGKVYENMMIDLQMNSKKLEERSKRTIMIVTGVSYQEAEKILREAGGHVKTAIVMLLTETGEAEAKKLLTLSDGFVKKAINLVRNKKG
ncbi:N-acetylmuramic acid 6-phosphate etherase [candidate division KSB1 bacterium]|nr:N-acetylmuramic acid 6-phosphate etherase [candidate division KSB1 bacterium]